jgi:hypothetical protein
VAEQQKQHPQQPQRDPYEGLNDPEVIAWIQRNSPPAPKK